MKEIIIFRKRATDFHSFPVAAARQPPAWPRRANWSSLSRSCSNSRCSGSQRARTCCWRCPKDWSWVEDQMLAGWGCLHRCQGGWTGLMGWMGWWWRQRRNCWHCYLGDVGWQEWQMENPSSSFLCHSPTHCYPQQHPEETKKNPNDCQQEVILQHAKVLC